MASLPVSAHFVANTRVPCACNTCIAVCVQTDLRAIRESGENLDYDDQLRAYARDLCQVCALRVGACLSVSSAHVMHLSVCMFVCVCVAVTVLVCVRL